MARQPVSKAAMRYDPHVFNPVENSNDWRGEQTTDCRHCPFPKANAVHVTSQELVADLPPKPPEDRSDQITGERDYDPEPQSTKE